MQGPRPLFRDRKDAGGRLAEALLGHRGEDVVVLAIARGGVPVAQSVAEALGAELDVTLARKLGAPRHPEFGFGAIAPGGIRVLDDASVRALDLSQEAIEQVEAQEHQELRRRLDRYRGNRPPAPVAGRTVILVDDGVATGVTARAALRSLRAQHPRRLIFAAPVGPRETAESLQREADDVVLLETPEPFQAVGQWYERFDQTSDEEVLDILRDGSPETSEMHIGTREVAVPIDSEAIDGTLTLPKDPLGLVIFAHGSGSSRSSPRNRYVARVLQERGIATLLLDLLTSGEGSVDVRTREHRFDIGLLARRLVGATHWARNDARLGRLPVGYFGSSTGAGAALVAAALEPARVHAVVSRGGRPDLAGNALPRVEASTLMLVGSLDDVVIRLNEDAASRMHAPTELRIVPGATHLFQEPGTLEDVAGQAGDWFARHFAPQPRARREREA